MFQQVASGTSDKVQTTFYMLGCRLLRSTSASFNCTLGASDTNTLAYYQRVTCRVHITGWTVVQALC